MDFLIVLVSWTLWLERNARTFNGKNSTAAELITRVLEQIEEWISAKFLTLARLGHSLHGRTSITAVI
jgi:hypothetical protein